MKPEMLGKVQLLAHAVAALDYRARKVLTNAPTGFDVLRINPATRSAVAIVSHMADLMEWSYRSMDQKAAWRTSPVGRWETEVTRFFDGLRDFADGLDEDLPPSFSPERFLQGPIADALTHVGQLATLRRIAGVGVADEDYYSADIGTVHDESA